MQREYDDDFDLIFFLTKRRRIAMVKLDKKKNKRRKRILGRKGKTEVIRKG